MVCRCPTGCRQASSPHVPGGRRAGLVRGHAGDQCGTGRQNLALASLPNFVLPGDISAPHRHYHEDGVFLNFELNADSTVSVPRAPGLGVAVDRARLVAVTLHAETFRAPV